MKDSAKLAAAKKSWEIMQQAYGTILAQFLRRLPQYRKPRAFLLMAVLPFMGVVAAFGIATNFFWT